MADADAVVAVLPPKTDADADAAKASRPGPTVPARKFLMQVAADIQQVRGAMHRQQLSIAFVRYLCGQKNVPMKLDQQWKAAQACGRVQAKIVLRLLFAYVRKHWHKTGWASRLSPLKNITKRELVRALLTEAIKKPKRLELAIQSFLSAV